MTQLTPTAPAVLIANAPPQSDSLGYRRRSLTAVLAAVFGGLSTLSLVELRLVPLAMLATVFGILGIVAIRRHPLEVTGVKPALAGLILGPLSFVGGIASYEIRMRMDIPPDCEWISWRELQPDEDRPGIPISRRAEELVGKKVFLRGYVYPSTRKSNLKQFILVRDNATCCFGGQPALTDMIIVKFVNDESIDYSYWERGLAGTFYIRPPTGQLSGVNIGPYYLEADFVK